MVATRHWAIMRVPCRGCFTKPTEEISYTPSTVLVLPTSTTSNIRCPPSQWTNAAGNHDPQSLVGAHPKKPPGIKAVGGATITAVFINLHELAVSVRRAGFDPLKQRAKLDGRDLNRIVDRPHQAAILAVERF